MTTTLVQCSKCGIMVRVDSPHPSSVTCGKPECKERRTEREAAEKVNAKAVAAVKKDWDPYRSAFQEARKRLHDERGRA